MRCAFICIAAVSLSACSDGAACHPPKEVVQAKTVAEKVAMAVRYDSAGWSGDQFRWNYCDGTSIWIANGVDSLGIDRSGGNAMPSTGAYADEYPHVRFEREHRQIWDAYEQWSEWKVLRP